MKKSQLKKIIKEEISKVLEMEIEKWAPEREWGIHFVDLQREAKEKYGKEFDYGVSDFQIPWEDNSMGIDNGRIGFEPEGKDKVKITYYTKPREEYYSQIKDLERGLKFIRSLK
jgi:hypothetical protein